MSRTDVHRPYWVQEHDPDNRHRIQGETHWHVERDCWDPATRQWLVERQRQCDIDEPGPSRHCRYWLTYNTCGCEICTQGYARKQNHRRARTRLRADLRNALKTAELLDVDIVEPRRGGAWILYGRGPSSRTQTDVEE